MNLADYDASSLDPACTSNQLQGIPTPLMGVGS